MMLVNKEVVLNVEEQFFNVVKIDVKVYLSNPAVMV
jgi:hypothetical protein